jgi:hypothetical protein
MKKGSTSNNTLYFDKNDWFQIKLDFKQLNNAKNRREIINTLESLKKNKQLKNWFIINKKKTRLKIQINKKSKDLIIEKLKNKIKDKSLDTFEPEKFQFGGKKGWEAHVKYFGALSLVAIKYNLFKNYDFVLLIITHLIITATEDKWEAWDILQRFLSIRGIQTKKLKNTIIKNKFNTTGEELKKPNRTKFVFKENAFLIKKLKKERFSLLFEKRKILPFTLVYIFNIFKISSKEQQKIIISLSNLLNPEKY